MNSKPIVMDCYYTIHTSFILNFEFLNNVTILIGNSGTGKTLSFSFLAESSLEDDRIVCLNDAHLRKDMKGILKSCEKKLIVIDHADILLDQDSRRYIAFDTKNQYFIIGRDVRDFLATEENLYELESIEKGERTEIFLKRYFQN
ncbi:MAG: ABC transporter ATP-binding protein [Eubacterium sp.]|nr:ABC transporter ATP-binding protein [Eubacterium sp.]